MYKFYFYYFEFLDVHLTNVAVQKMAPDYDPEKGCKWSMSQLRRYFLAKHGQDKVITISEKNSRASVSECEQKMEIIFFLWNQEIK